MNRKPLAYILSVAMALQGAVPVSAAQQPYFRMQSGKDGAANPGDPTKDTDTTVTVSGGPSGTLVTRIGRAPASAAPSASPSPVTWSLVGTTAPGIDVNPSTGALVGAATADRNAWGPMRLQAAYATPDGKTVTGSGAPFSIRVLPLPSVSYQASMTLGSGGATPGPAVVGALTPSYAFAGAAPQGLSLNAATGVITAQAPGTYSGLVVALTDRFDNATATSQPFSITALNRATSFSVLANPSLRVGSYFETKLAPSGLTPAIHYTLTPAGGLPPGLAITESADGQGDLISGRPTAAGSYTFTVTATSAADNLSASAQQVTWTVVQPKLAYADTSVGAGTAVSASPSVKDGLDGATYALKAPVAGYSVNAGNGLVTGTATTGDQTITVVATTVDHLTFEGTLKVTGRQTSFSMTTGATYVSSHVGFPVSKAYTTNSTASSLAWTVSSGTLPDGITLAPSTGVVSGKGTVPGIASGVVVTARDPATNVSASSQPVTYQVFALPGVPTSGPYTAKANQSFTATIQATNLIGEGRYSTDPSKLPPGLALSAAGVLSGTPTAAGDYDGIVVAVSDAADGASGQSQPFTISVAPDSNDLVVTGVPAQYAVRQQRSLTTTAPAVQNNVCSVTWGLAPESAALPTGLTVDPATGVIFGTPSNSGDVPNVILQATETCTTRSGALQTRIRLASADPGFRIAQSSTGTTTRRTAKSRPFTVKVAQPLAVTGVAQTYQLKVASTVAVAPQASGVLGQTSWTLSGGSLPQTMNFDPSTGRITGPALAAGRVPDTTGSSALTLTAADSFDGATAQSQPFSMTVEAGLVVIGPTRFSAQVGKAYSSGAMFIVTNATSPVSWSVVGNLPPGLSVNASTGEMFGTPTAPGGFPDLRMQATQADGQTGQSSAFSITVTGGLSVTAPGYSAGHVNKQIAPIVPAVTGATGAVRWSVQSGSLPPGLGMDPATGAIKGIPTATGVYHGIFVGAQDSTGASGVSSEMAVEINNGMTWQVTANFAKARRYAKFISPPVYAAGGSGAVTYRLSTPIADWVIDPNTGAITGSAQTGYLWGGWLVAVDASGATLDHPTYVPPITPPFEYPGRSYITSTAGITLSNWPGYTFNSMGAITWAKEGDWPAWASLNPASGYITGTPPVAGTYTLTTRVTDTFDNTGGTFDRIFTINPNGQPDPEHGAVTWRNGHWNRIEQFLAAPGDVAGNVTWTVTNDPRNGAFSWFVSGDDAHRFLGWQQGASDSGFFPNITITATGDAGGSHTWIYDVTVLPQLTAGFGGGTGCAWPGDAVDTGPLAVNGSISTPIIKMIDYYDGVLPYQNGWPSWLAVDNTVGRFVGVVPNDDTATYNVHYGAQVTDPYDNTFFGLGYSRLRTYANLDFDLPAQVKSGYVARTPDGYDFYGAPNQFTTHGAPDGFYYQVTSGVLPEGMSIDNGGQGRLSGNPQYPGTYPVTVTLFAWQCDQLRQVSKSFNIIVKTADPAKWMSTPVSIYARMGVPFRSSPLPYIANKGSETWTFDQRNGPRPTGVGFDPASGAFYGTPQNTQNDTYRLQAYSNTGEYVLGTWSQFVVTPGPQVIEQSVSVPANVPANISPNATGFVGSVTYATTAAAPTGMSFDPASGSFLGVPTVPGTYGPYVVTGTEDALPQVGPNDPVPAHPAASSASFTITVMPGPYVDRIDDQARVIGKPFYIQPTAGGFTGAVTWHLNGDLPLGVQLDANTGMISGWGTAYTTKTLSLRVTDAAGNAADSNVFTLKVTDEDGNVPDNGWTSWTWGPQVCIYSCGGSGSSSPGGPPQGSRAASGAATSCKGRQIQNCSGAGCVTATRGCDAPYLGGDTSNPVGSWSPECLNPMLPPNDHFCPPDDPPPTPTTTVPTEPSTPTETPPETPTTDIPTGTPQPPAPVTYPGLWTYKNVFMQFQHTRGFIVNTYQLTCYVGTAESDASQCGPSPTTNTSCKMNAYGLGWCDPVINRYTDGNHYNGYSNGYNWYD